ncbi:MAG: 6,7-dimethyl-8-ribityllumazine synthase [Acidimicrobiales bacterium]|nr:6,7-dimethyl-8-ribityllumazine synthase [Acidimicrobiales bacterium]MCB1260901.1 6,7-dimethyl-8-ribityllumazine synthase [Acidimicrobiales bacterium]
MAKNLRAADAAQLDLDGTGMRVAVVCGRFNDLITNRLLAGTEAGLQSLGVADDDVTVAWVPGAFELPMTAKAFADTGRFDAVIALGCVIRGETAHFDYVAGECAAGIMRAQLETGLPIVFGVLTTENLDQALARSGGDEDKGRESAEVAVEMVGLLRAIRA